MSNKKFNPSKIQCLSCLEIIFSKYPGQWVACKCFKNEVGNVGCYIDSTEYYTRVGGSSSNYKWIENNDTDK